MYLFINYPESKFNVESLIEGKKAKLITLEVSYDVNLKKDDIINILSGSLADTKEISIVIFHPAGIVGMVDVRMIPLVVESIKDWIKVPLVTISRGGKEYLDPAKDSGADAALSINEFHQVWEDCSGEESKLLSWLEGFVSIKKAEHIFIRIISSFLPLDIDLQALGMLTMDKKKEYLTNDDPQKPLGMLKDKTINYNEKLEKAQKEIEGIPELKANPVIIKLLGMDTDNSKISNFLNSLDEKKQKIINGGTIEDSKINDIITHFSKDGGWKVEGANPQIIKSFHNWYCALASCFRGEKACKEY